MAEVKGTRERVKATNFLFESGLVGFCCKPSPYQLGQEENGSNSLASCSATFRARSADLFQKKRKVGDIVEEAVMDTADWRREEEKGILMERRQATDVLLKCQKTGYYIEMHVMAHGRSQAIQE